MSRKLSRWLTSRNGRVTLLGGLALLLMVVVLGQVLGWWSALYAYLGGTARAPGVYPVQIELSSFTGTAVDGHVVVRWETQIEQYNAGFNLYRKDPGPGPLIPINAGMIPSHDPEGPAGAVYELVDTSVTAGTMYDYWLENVDLYGARTYQGTITVTVSSSNVTPTDLPNSVFLPLVSR